MTVAHPASYQHNILGTSAAYAIAVGYDTVDYRARTGNAATALSIEITGTYAGRTIANRKSLYVRTRPDDSTSYRIRTAHSRLA